MSTDPIQDPSTPAKEVLRFKVTREDKRRLKAASKQAGAYNFSEWARSVLLKEAGRLEQIG